MKQLTTKSMNYYVQSFSEWLKVVGYSDVTVYASPRILQEFFCWLEQNNIDKLENITAQDTENFINYNKTRANKRTEGGISAGHVNRYIEVINKFNEYLKKVSNLEIPIKAIRLENSVAKQRIILSTDEIKQLYTATNESPMGMRDRAMLAVYYGCGLRRTEGVQLDVSDVLIERKMLYIRKTKNNHERYTPITTASLKHIEQYMYNARPLLIGEKSSEQGLFISELGTRISKARFYQCLKQLCKTAGITKEIGIHNLRHSIATHLLQSGMELENIALFLGHRCLDSTQLYTHILNEQ